MSESQASAPPSTSTPSEPNLLESAKADKVALAMLLQRGQQEQDTDKLVLDSNKRWRENHHRLFEARMEKFGAKGAGTGSEDEMGRNILIDSPTTENHYHQPPPSVPAPSSGVAGLLTKAALTAALVGGGGGVGYLLNNWLKPSTSTTIENTNGFLLKLLPSEKK